MVFWVGVVRRTRRIVYSYHKNALSLDFKRSGTKLENTSLSTGVFGRFL